MNKAAPGQKYAWCRRELGVEVAFVNKAGPKFTHALVVSQHDDQDDGESPPGGAIDVVTCWSRNKFQEVAGARCVLIDDDLVELAASCPTTSRTPTT